MLQAFYSSTVGAQQQMQRLNVYANNISNVNTYGYKAQVPAFQALMYGMLDGIDGSQLPRGSGTVMALTGSDMGDTFADNNQLAKAESGLFDANGQQAQLAQNSQVMWQYVEESNVDMLQEMSRMMTAQQALQGGAQILKLYDSLLTKSTTEVGRL